MKRLFGKKEKQTRAVYYPPEEYPVDDGSVFREGLEKELAEGNTILMDDYLSQDTWKPEKTKVETKGAKTSEMEVFVETAMDVSLTGQTYFPAMYLAMQELIGTVEQAKEVYPNVVVKYGLTMFHEELQEIVSFEEGPFTENGQEYLKHLRAARFSGGSEDGYENLNEGLSYSVDKLESHTPKDAKRILFGFSDSCQKEEERTPDFMGMGMQGIHAAVIFCNEEDQSSYYEPVFRKPDRTDALTKILSIDKLAKLSGRNSMTNAVLGMISQAGEAHE